MFLGAEHEENARRTWWVVVLTAVMMVGEIIAGYLTGSMALLADGFHMATHAGALSVAAGAYSYAKRHSHDRTFSFGTGKVGDLAGFASAMVLGLIALGVGVESVLRLSRPINVAFGEATIIAAVGLAVNIASAFLLSGGHGHLQGTGTRTIIMDTGITTMAGPALTKATTICAQPTSTFSPTRLPRFSPSPRC